MPSVLRPNLNDRLLWAGPAGSFACVAIVAALAAALFYAVASVLQQWEAERQPTSKALRLGLLARLAKRPLWLAGLLFDVGGYVLQWLALSWGSLVVVQPLLVVGLLFALPMRARLSACRFGRWDWSGALLTTAGLAIFLTVSNPAAGHSNVSLLTWLLLLCAGAVVVLPLVAAGHGSSPRWKAMAFGTAGGVVYGLCAALTKTCARLLSGGISHLFSSWQPYVLLAAGAAGMVLAQSAFQAGPLDVSLPALSATDPIVSVIVGAVAFGETIRGGAFITLLEVVSFSAVVIGIFMLGQTEAVKVAQHRHVRNLDNLGSEPRAAV